MGEGLIEGPGSVVFRRVKPTDLDLLEGLVVGAMEHPWTPTQLATALAAASSRGLLAIDAASPSPRDSASSGGPASLPIGFILARRILDGLEIDLVGVERSRRREGVARALLGGLIESERAQGVASVQLELAASNGAALGLYQGLGFVVVGRRSRYYPDGDDALLLTKAFD